MAAQSSRLNTPSTQSKLLRGIPRTKPPVPPSRLNVSQHVVQNLSKDLNCLVSSQKKKQSLTKPIPHKMVLEQSKFSKKVCGFHNQSSMKQQNVAQRTQISNRKAGPIEDVNNRVQFSHFSGSNGEAKGLDSKEKSAEPLRGHEKARQKRNREVLQCDPRNTEFLAASSRTLASGVECSLDTENQKKPEDVDYISKEVADTIKRIESYLPVVQLVDDPVDLGGDKNTAHQGLCEKKLKSIPIADSDSPKVVERKKGSVSRAELSQAGNLGLAQNDLPRRQGIRGLRKPSDSSMWQLVMSPSHKSTSEGIDLLGLNKDEPKLPDWVGIETFKPLQKSNSQLNGLESRKGGQSKGSNFPANMLSPFWSPSMGMTTPQSQKMTLLPGQDVKAVVEKFELVNQLASQNDPGATPASDTIQGFRIPSHKDIVKEAPLLVKVLNQVPKENRDKNVVMSHKGTIRKGVTPRSSVMPQSVGTAKKIRAAHADQKLNQTGTREKIRKKKNLPPQMIVRPTLLDHCPSQKSLLPSAMNTDRTNIKGSGKQKQTYVSPRRRIMQPNQQQSEGTNSSSCTSSSWTTQQTSSTYSSDSKGKEPLPGQAPLPWRRSGHATHSTSSEEDCSGSIQPQYEHWDSSRRMTGIRKFRPGYPDKSQKAVGRLRRLKNKLAVVFHHHHHHHHHHEDTEAGHSRSLWKYVQKMFHPISKEEACEEEAVEKFRSSAVINAPHKQKGRHHLHAMVEGLLNHVWNSKKSKAGRGGINQVMNGQHGNKKMGKNLHWWQSSGGGGGLKLPNRGRVKLRFKSKKPQLRAGKMK